MQFHNFIVSNNWAAGLAGKEMFVHSFSDGDFEVGQRFQRSIVIGAFGGDRDLADCGDKGAVLLNFY